MADQTPSDNTLCGFLVPWAFSSTLAADHDRANDFDEADRRPEGVVVPAGGKLVLEPSGDAETAAANDYYIVTPRPGVPGPDGLGVAFATSSGGTFHGANKPTCLAGWEENTAATSGLGWDQLTLDDQTVVAVSWGHSGSSFFYYAHARDKDDGTWSQVTIASSPDGGNTQSGVALVQAPDGTLLAYWLSERAGKPLLACSRSADDGATWVLQSDDVCGTLVQDVEQAVIVNRIRAASNQAGQILILIEWEDSGVAPIEHVAQYLSVDGGATATYVDDLDGGSLGDVCVLAGYFVVATINGSTDAIQIRRTADASQPLFDISATDLTDTRPTTENHGMAFLVSPDGVLYLYSVAATAIGATDDLYCHRSNDYGSTWQTRTQMSIPVYYGGIPGGGANGVSLSNFDVSWTRGFALMMGCEVDHNATLTAGDVHGLYFGGHHSVTLTRDAWGWTDFNPLPPSPPTAEALLAPPPRSSGGNTWTPMTTLANGWGANNDIGTPLRITSSIGTSITTAVGEKARNAASVTISNAGSKCMAFVIVKVSSGTYEFQVSTGDGSTDGCDVQVSVTSTQISFQEQGGSTSYANHNLTGYIYILVACDAGNAKGRAWYGDASLLQPRTLTELSAVTTTGTTTNCTANSQVPASSVAIIKALGLVAWDFTTSSIGPDWINDGLSSTDLDGIPIGATVPTYLDDGIRVAGREGYAYGSSDEYQIPIRGQRPKENLLPAVKPSPRFGWRSAGTSSTYTLKYTFDADNAAAMRVGSPVFGIFLDGLYGVGNVVIKDNGSSVGTATLAYSVAMTRAGNALYPTESGSDVQGVYIEHDELVGGMVDLGSGDVRKISGNTAGALQSGATVDTRRTTIWIEGVDGTEAASGTFTVYPPRALILIYEHGNWTRLDIEISSSNPAVPEDYREIGIVAAGPVYCTGYLNSRQTTLAFEDGAVMTTLEDGTRRAVERHPVRRRAEVSWTHSPIDVYQIRQASTTAPDYVLAKTGGSTPAAMLQDLPLLMTGLYAGLNGKSAPIVWLPYVPVSTGMATHLVSRAYEALYGRIVGPIRRERSPTVGLTLQSEMFMLSTATIEEEL